MANTFGVCHQRIYPDLISRNLPYKVEKTSGPDIFDQDLQHNTIVLDEWWEAAKKPPGLGSTITTQVGSVAWIMKLRQMNTAPQPKIHGTWKDMGAKRAIFPIQESSTSAV